MFKLFLTTACLLLVVATTSVEGTSKHKKNKSKSKSSKPRSIQIHVGKPGVYGPKGFVFEHKGKNLAYGKPAEVKAGTKVDFVFGNDGHNVKFVEVPSACKSDCKSHLDSKGFITKSRSHSVTFNVKGTYKFVCGPHVRQNMVGFIKVN